MHYFGGGWFWGMHQFWWLFWIAVIVLFFVLRAAPRNKPRETPLQILQRRYAAGEISTQEYEERKAKLEQS
jgi:putative membrane protein